MCNKRFKRIRRHKRCFIISFPTTNGCYYRTDCSKRTNLARKHERTMQLQKGFACPLSDAPTKRFLTFPLGGQFIHRQRRLLFLLIPTVMRTEPFFTTQPGPSLIEILIPHNTPNTICYCPITSLAGKKKTVLVNEN